MTRSLPISAAQASKASRVLCSKLGTPETSSGFVTGGTSHYHASASWRFRHDDGSPESRLGFGPTRKMVTITSDEKGGEISYAIHVHINRQLRPL